MASSSAPPAPRLAVLLALGGLLSCAGRARSAEGEPVLAIAPPVDTDPDLAGRIAPLLAEELEALGFRVASDPEVGRSLAVITDERAFDPLTAPMTEAAFRSERAGVHRALVERFSADRVLYSEIVPRQAAFEDGIARWDGARCEIGAEGEPPAQARGYSGLVDALSLHVWIEDQDAKRVAEGFGGVELCARFRSGRWQRVPPEHRLRDAERLRAGVRAALSALPPMP